MMPIHYIRNPVSGLLDPDLTVGDDPARPLVFYQLDWPGESLRATRQASRRVPTTLRFRRSGTSEEVRWG